MASMREKAAIGISSAILATGLVTALQPPSRDLHEQQRSQTEKQIGELNDAVEKEHERYRRDGIAHGEAENAGKLVPGEYRPRVPFRLP